MSKELCESLEAIGKHAHERWEQIDTNTPGTLCWLYGAKANRGDKRKSAFETQIALGAWLAKDTGIFWITGRPGSGKSTAMKHLSNDESETANILQNNTEKLPMSQLSWTWSPSATFSEYIDAFSDAKPSIPRRVEWCIIKLFVTSRGSENQRKWQPMLHGILWQLLTQRPELIRGIMNLTKKKKTKFHSTKQNSPDASVQERYEWTAEIIEQALEVCKDQVSHPLKVLIVLDGLDEMQDIEDIRQCISFLKRLSKSSTESQNIFKVCVSSRSEQVFLDLLSGIWRIEIHDHTRDDIYQHVFSQIRKIRRFRNVEQGSIDHDLGRILDYISENAHGVFLWATSVCNMVLTALGKGEILQNAYDILVKLPREMSELYTYILRGIDPPLRTKAYIMLESVLRARTPLTLLELALIVHVTERRIAGKPNPWSDHPTQQYPSPKDFLNPVRLQTQLITGCRCILETSSGVSGDDYRYNSIYRDEGSSNFELSDENCKVLGVSNSSGDSSGSDNQVVRYETHDRNFIEGIKTSEKNGGFTAKPIYDSNMVVPSIRETELKRMERAEYGELDHARAMVRFLHRSAKDSLLEPGCLDDLFEDDKVGTTPISARRHGNGHVYILYFAREWLNLPDNVKYQLRCHFDAVQEIAYNTSQLESTLGSTGAAPFFGLLDELDRKLALQHSLGGMFQTLLPLNFWRPFLETSLGSYYVLPPYARTSQIRRCYVTLKDNMLICKQSVGPMNGSRKRQATIFQHRNSHSRLSRSPWT